MNADLGPSVDGPRPLYVCPVCGRPVVWITADREGRPVPTVDAGKWRHAACHPADPAQGGDRRAPRPVELP